MRRRERRVGSFHAGTVAKSMVGAGVAAAVPASGALLAAAPAQASIPEASQAGAAKAASNPVLHFGSTGNAVKVVQARVGVSPDGVFGPMTLAAVKRFQSANGLSADGVVGPLTWAKVGSSAAASATSPAKTKPTTGTPAKTTTSTSAMACAASATTLRYGSSGQLVKILQSRVGVSADGFFGAQTQGAVSSFQSSHGLMADGVVGPLTWGKLGCTGASAPVTTPAKTTTVSTTSPISTKPGSATTSAKTTQTASGAAVVAMAKNYIGTPYVWGGSSPSGFDCSGLTSYVFKQFGIYIPRTAAQQQAYFKSVSTPQVGDLIFYGQPAYHVAIYVGNGLMIDAAHPGTLVGIRSMYGNPSGYARVI